MPTTRESLAQRKPAMKDASRTKPNTKGMHWVNIESVDVANWDAFSISTIEALYGHILDLPLPEDAKIPDPRGLDGIASAGTSDISYLIEWNGQVMDATINVSIQQLPTLAGLAIGNEYARPGGQKPAAIGGHRLVHHVLSLDVNPAPRLVVGLGKPSSYWTGQQVTAAMVERNPSQANSKSITANLLAPLRQLANLCKAAGTRYGYVQSNVDLTVCRFRELGSDNKFGVDIKVVPWSTHGVQHLTTDLALWSLTMLAIAAPEHRGIVSRKEISEIDTIQNGSLVYGGGGVVTAEPANHQPTEAVQPATPGLHMFSPATEADIRAFMSSNFPAEEFQLDPHFLEEDDDVIMFDPNQQAGN